MFDRRAPFRRCPFKGDSLRKQEEVSLWFIRPFPDPVPTSPRDPAKVLPHISRSAKFHFTMLLYSTFISNSLLTTFLCSYQEAITKSVHIFGILFANTDLFFKAAMHAELVKFVVPEKTLRIRTSHASTV